jgi:VIT1/CCC1 family predicted Fe2+/Mn2+ transporter
MDIIQRNYKDELIAYNVYYRLSKMEEDEKKKEVLETLSLFEKKHSEIWRKFIEVNRLNLPKITFLDKLKIGSFVLARKILGLGITTKLLELGEEGDIEKYLKLYNNPSINGEMKEALKEIITDEIAHEQMLTAEEPNVEDLRDRIYGISDGLIEVLAAVSGLASIFVSPLLVAIGGLIVGISGMISMSVGAYLSSKSEEDVSQAKRRKIEMQRKIDGEALKGRLEEFLENKGVKESTAERVARQLNDVAEDIISPKGAVNPKKSAYNTAISYIIGAIIPILPYLLGVGGLKGVIVSYLITGISTFIIGFMIGVISSVNPWKKGAEMTSLAILAALATHLIGSIFSPIIS